MSDVATLLARCQELGARFTPTPDGKLKVKAPAPLPEELQKALKERKAEIVEFLRQTQPRPRDVLSRPVGQEDNPDTWASWAPFLAQLKEADAERYQSIQQAEAAVRSLEDKGVSTGQEYEAAMALLFYRFEMARRWLGQQALKVWVV
jgi:hypothetical protein